MLILTTNALLPGSETPQVPEWPGAHVLVILPGSGLGRSAIEALNETWIVLEFLQMPTGAWAVLADVAGWLGHLLRDVDGPVLYLDRPLDPEALAAEAAQGLARPLEVTSELGPEGRLSLLRLGEMVASSPLLPGFFNFLKGRDITDAQFADLLTHTFASDTA